MKKRESRDRQDLFRFCKSGGTTSDGNVGVYPSNISNGSLVAFNQNVCPCLSLSILVFGKREVALRSNISMGLKI